MKISGKMLRLKKSIEYHLRYSRGKSNDEISAFDMFHALALAIREYMVDGMKRTENDYREKKLKRMYYLSMEYLMGRSLENNLCNLGVFDLCKEVLSKFEVNLEEIIEAECDAALGNGGLGRLAACFLDSLATLGIPGFGYGINYEFGLFKQEIENGYQKEKPDHWLREGSPWLIKRSDEVCAVRFGGYVEHRTDTQGNYVPTWKHAKVIHGVPYDTPVVGYGGKTVNYLRLYAALSSEEFDIEIFNRGDYIKAVEKKIMSETISKVLYPSDSIDDGRKLRLSQEYFLVACALHDIVRRYRAQYDSFDQFSNKVAIQLNDTHPALAIAELMRIFVDESALSWTQAWEIVVATCSYTNHTLMGEALEKWSVPLLAYLLPRHLQIIYEINERFLRQVAGIWPEDVERLRRMSIIEESDPKQVCMAHLAMIGSHSVNGVAKLHTELMKEAIAPDFYQLWPSKFNNKTNGITQRRWLLKANPLLAKLITKTTGDGWIISLPKIRSLELQADDKEFQHEFLSIKRQNKEALAQVIFSITGIVVDIQSIFDVHIKRIHEYKRQLLNIMRIIYEYFRIAEDGCDVIVPHTYIFSGKAAPGYWAAKQIIKLINNVASVINNDARVHNQMKVVFIPDYRVSLAEKIIPAADFSEQISTAGTEASGTGNMKLALNGALTIGTLDGANVEIMREVGEENIFIFGLRVEEIREMRLHGLYEPASYYKRSPVIRRVMDALRSDFFCRDEPGLFRWIFDAIMVGDPYFHLADIESYIAIHERATQEYSDKKLCTKKRILNIARIGRFSSDRTVAEYAREIWNIPVN